MYTGVLYKFELKQEVLKTGHIKNLYLEDECCRVQFNNIKYTHTLQKQINKMQNYHNKS